VRKYKRSSEKIREVEKRGRRKIEEEFDKDNMLKSKIT